MAVVSLQAEHTFRIVTRNYGWLEQAEYAAVSRPSAVMAGGGVLWDIYVRRVASAYVGKGQQPESMAYAPESWTTFATGITVAPEPDAPTALNATLRLHLSSMNVQSVEVMES